MSTKPVAVRFVPGINPEPDETNQNTRQCIDGNNIRFYRGSAQTMGGSAAEILTGATISGKPRGVFSFARGTSKWTIIATHSKLYARLGAYVTNITPLQASATATLANNPLTTTNGSDIVTVAYTAHGLAVGDRIKLSGASDVGGLTASSVINKEHLVNTVPNANSFTIDVGANASSGATGGGASVEIFKEIAAGAQDASSASGAGVGLAGSGLAGENQTDTSLLVQPRIVPFDTFGDDLVLVLEGKPYKWEADTATAPTLISGAPDSQWLFVDDAKLCVLDDNTTANSDVGDYTDWTPGSASSAFSDVREDAVKLISEANVNGEHLIFAEENKVFRTRFVGGAVKWQWQKLTDNVGIVGPLGRVVVNGVCYIFGKDNLYRYNGGIFEPLPGFTLRRFLFDNLNRTQQYKCFVWYNALYDEVHFHFPHGSNLECSHAVIYSIAEGHFTKREIDRTAGEQYGQIFAYPLLASSDGAIHQHESGFNNSGVAQDVYVQIAYSAIRNGDVLTDMDGMEPDAVVEGTMYADLYGKSRMQGTPALLGSYPVTDSTEQIDFLKSTRWRSWMFRQNELNGFFRTGRMVEYIGPGSAE